VDIPPSFLTRGASFTVGCSGFTSEFSSRIARTSDAGVPTASASSLPFKAVPVISHLLGTRAFRKYSISKYEAQANEFMRKKFGATGLLPPKMMEVLSCYEFANCQEVFSKSIREKCGKKNLFTCRIIGSYLFCLKRISIKALHQSQSEECFGSYVADPVACIFL
jgi:hypothetical protein